MARTVSDRADCGLGVFSRIKKFYAELRRELVRGSTSVGYDQFETSPEAIEQELRPAVCERRPTDRLKANYSIDDRPVGKRSQIFSRRVYYRCKLEYKHDYPDRLFHLKLKSLELRRLYNDITMFYKIVHKLTSLNDDVGLLLSYHNANNNYHVLARGHTLKLKKNAFRLNVARNHFLQSSGICMEWIARTYCYCCFTYTVQEIFTHQTFHPISSLIGICKHYTCIIYQYPTLCGI